jgi:hypothetical protein
MVRPADSGEQADGPHDGIRLLAALALQGVLRVLVRIDGAAG